MQRRLVGRARESFAQHPHGIGVAILHPERIGERDVRRHVRGVERERRAKRRVRIAVAAKPRIERAERDARLGPIGRVPKRRFVLGGGACERRVGCRVRRVGKHRRGVDAQRAQRIAQQRCQNGPALRRRRVRKRGDARVAHEWIGIADGAFCGIGRLRRRKACERLHGARTRERRLRQIAGDRREVAARLGGAALGVRERRCIALQSLRSMAEPGRGSRRRPIAPTSWHDTRCMRSASRARPSSRAAARACRDRAARRRP